MAPGVLGGVIRIQPNMPVMDRTAGKWAAHSSIVRHGADGGDFAAMVNIPLVSGVAVRAVGYRRLDPGYIDDSLRKLKDVNYGSSFVETAGKQSSYLELGLETRLAFDRWAVSLGATNLTDVRGDRFAIGNLKTTLILNEKQSPPLRPRTMHLGV